MHDGTRVVHAGKPTPARSQPFLPGPCFAATYHLSGEPTAHDQTYGRSQNPTWTHFEAALAELEGGPCTVFASGMAAISAVFGSVLRPGDVLMMPSDGYYTARLLAQGYFTAIGVQVRLFRTAEISPAQSFDGVKLLWLESPCNPTLDVCDIPALADRAHAAGALVAVDNTTITPLGQQPLALGADFSVASDTKALLGHSDLLMGHVATRDSDWHLRIVEWRTRIGAIPGPMEVWLAHRSLGTLELRLERMEANARALAEYLRGVACVRNVRYPGLPSDPAHALAARQMRRFGTIIGFELADQERADRLLQRCQLIAEATSFGGIHSTAERRARWGGDPVSDGFIRLSAGCENTEDLLADVAQAIQGID